MHSLRIFFLLLPFAAHQVAAQDNTQQINRGGFYSSCANSFPNPLFKGESKKTFDSIFDYWLSTKYKDKRWLAYIFATAYRESAGTMQPVREGKSGKCKTDQCSIDTVTAMINKRNGELRKENKKEIENYSLPVNGKSYFGRGLVQITHKRNYARVGQTLGWGNQLVENPGLALDREKAITILIEGAVQGMFSKDKETGEWRKLSTYLNDQTTDWVGARKVINPGVCPGAYTG